MRRAGHSRDRRPSRRCCSPPRRPRPRAPTLGAVSATDIQGVSALLKGTVNPQGLVDHLLLRVRRPRPTSPARLRQNRPPASRPGSGLRRLSRPRGDLGPHTRHHLPLPPGGDQLLGHRQTDGTATFTTTHGFGFLSGTNGFAASAFADGGAAATQADSHPYQLDFTIGLNQGGEFEDQPGDVFADGDLRDLKIEMPPGLIVNPAVVDKCTLRSVPHPAQLALRDQPLGGELPRQIPGRHGRGENQPRRRADSALRPLQPRPRPGAPRPARRLAPSDRRSSSTPACAPTPTAPTSSPSTPPTSPSPSTSTGWGSRSGEPPGPPPTTASAATA